MPVPSSKATIHSALDAAWPHLRSDLPSNPRLHFGKFNNGARYAWMDNREPKNRLYLRLHVNAGSVAEEEGERGMAHMVEHLCFNGTKNFPPGMLMKWFQKHGMGFGADTNAYTGFYQTVYMLDPPKSNETTARESLLVLLDFASGLAVTEENLESEKRVIDAEEVESLSVELRCLRAALNYEFKGSKIARRLPIGERAVRARWKPEDILKFYKKWYRPENFTIILAGDLRGLDAELLLNDTFGNIKKRGDRPVPPPVIGDARRARNTAWIHDPELAAAGVSISKARPWSRVVQSAESLRRSMMLRFARQMFNIRLDETVKNKNCKLLQCAVSDLRESSAQMATYLEDGESISGTCAAADWKEALAACEQELRRLLQFGFTDGEFEMVRARTARVFEEAVERESSRPTPSFIVEMLYAAEFGMTPRDAKANFKLAAEMLASLTKEKCLELYAEAWSKGELVVGGGGNIQLGPGADAKIMNVYKSSLRAPVERGSAAAVGEFAYKSEPVSKTTIASRAIHEKFNIHQATLKNGVRIFIKSTKFQKNQIYLSAQVGRGRAGAPSRDAALEYVSEEVFVACGLRRHGFDEISRLIAGKSVELQMKIEEESFHFAAATTRADMLLQCEVLNAYLTDPGFREEGFREFKDQMEFDYKQYLLTPEGILETKFLKDLYRGMERWSTPDYKNAAAVTLPNVKKWLSNSLANGPVDLAVVGDLQIDDTLQILGRIFGRDARRPEAKLTLSKAPARFAEPGEYTYTCDSKIKKACIKIIFPATDRRDTSLARRIDFLAGVLNERLRETLRERLGAVYAPEASAEMSMIFAGDGYISIDVFCDPKRVRAIISECLGVAGELARGGVRAHELNKLRKIALNYLRDARRTNDYWISALAHAMRREHSLDDLLTETESLRKLTIADLDPLANRYLSPDRAIIGVVAPKK